MIFFTFQIKESETNKMIKWWEETYKHLKVYSVCPWTGKQCTTTVKTAIQEAFSWHHPNYISDETQKPIGLLNKLKKFVSTSKQHKNEKINIEVIKEEAIDFH